MCGSVSGLLFSGGGGEVFCTGFVDMLGVDLPAAIAPDEVANPEDADVIHVEAAYVESAAKCTKESR